MRTTPKLFLNVRRQQVKSITFLDAKGKPLQLSDGGTMSSRSSVTFTKSRKGTLPPQARIVVELHDKLTEYKATFSLKNIDLIGNPLQK